MRSFLGGFSFGLMFLALGYAIGRSDSKTPETDPERIEIWQQYAPGTVLAAKPVFLTVGRIGDADVAEMSPTLPGWRIVLIRGGRRTAIYAAPE